MTVQPLTQTIPTHVPAPDPDPGPAYRERTHVHSEACWWNYLECRWSCGA